MKAKREVDTRVLKDIFNQGLEIIESALSYADKDPIDALEEMFAPYDETESDIDKDELRIVFHALRALAGYRTEATWATEHLRLDDILDYIRKQDDGATYELIEHEFRLSRSKAQAAVRALSQRGQLERADFPGPIVCRRS